MFNWQEIAVFLIVLCAAAYGIRSLYRRSRSFTSRSRCESNCGCSDSAKGSVLE